MLWLILGSCLYLLGSAADVYTTKRAVIDNPTKFHEANPFMGWVLRRFGMVGFCVAKVIPLAGLCAVGIRLDAQHEAGVGLGLLGVYFGIQGYRNRALKGK
jgi:hypothetical protein